MRNKLGLIQIKVRAKDSSTIDFSSITYDDLEINGKLEDAKGGKLIYIDLILEDLGGNFITYKGITSLINESYIRVVGYNDYNDKLENIYLTFDDCLIVDYE